jgi:hypothetical protein
VGECVCRFLSLRVDCSHAHGPLPSQQLQKYPHVKYCSAIPSKPKLVPEESLFERNEAPRCNFVALVSLTGIRKRGLLCSGQILSNTLIGQAASFYHFFLFDENFNSGTLRLSKRRRPLCAQCVPPAQYQAAVPPLAAVA